MKSFSAQGFSDLDQDFVDQVLIRQAGRPGALLAILQQVQNHHPRKYLPLETLQYIATKAAIPLSRIYSVATFYALFNLEPQGRNTISVCRGTACHTRGSRDLFEKLLMNFGFKSAADDEMDQLSITAPDGSATLRTVACFGQCALAPVIEVNHAIFGHMNERMLQHEIDALDKRDART
jgi:NADH-quinone oxidoreductase subunit E